MAGHGDWVTRLAFSPDERFLASASQDYTVRIWRVINGRLQQTIDEGLSGVTDLAYAPDGNTLAWSEADSSVRIFDLADDRFSQILPAGGPAATSITFYQSENIQDSHIVAAGYADGRVRIWDTRDGALMTEFVSHINSPVTSLDFSRSGNLLVTASRDARLRLWQVDVTRGDTPQTTLSPTDTTTSQVSSEPQMQIRAALVLLGHEAPITRAIFSPQGNWIASASEDGVILVWSIPGTDTRPEE
jgi:WD40 repeat protein